MKVFFVNVGNLEENKQKCTPPPLDPPPAYLDPPFTWERRVLCADVL